MHVLEHAKINCRSKIDLAIAFLTVQDADRHLAVSREIAALSLDNVARRQGTSLAVRSRGQIQSCRDHKESEFRVKRRRWRVGDGRLWSPAGGLRRGRLSRVGLFRRKLLLHLLSNHLFD